LLKRVRIFRKRKERIRTPSALRSRVG
jgi:hypothetical protein